MAKINKENLQLFVVCEGVAYSIEYAPKWLNQDNWMCDWIFVGAYSQDEAIAVATVVDDLSNKRQGRIYTKASSIREIRGRLLGEDAMTPASIYATQGNSVNSERLQFNQGWVTI